MKIHIILLIAISLSTPAFAAGKAGTSDNLRRIISTHGEFKKFWNAAKDKNPEERAGLFRKIVISKNKPIYRDMVEKTDEKLLERAEKTLADITQSDADAILANFSRFKKAIPARVALFRKKFPDAQLATKFWLGVSLRFNGKATMVDFDRAGKHAVTGFGMEHFKSAGDSKVNAIISHELTHVYRAEVLGQPPGHIKPMVAAAISEGLATYASGAINGINEDSVILFDDKLSEECNANCAGLARKFMRDMDSEDSETRNIWFSGNPNSSGLPNRAGYCIGLKAVERMAKDNDMDSLIRMPWDKIRDEFISALKTLSK